MHASPGGFATGWPSLDGLLGGGWPRGALVEILGHGRATLIQAAAASLLASSALPVVWIDGPRSFCPETMPHDPRRLVLVRPPPGSTRARTGQALLAADLCLRSRAFALVVLDLPAGTPPTSTFFRLARRAAKEDVGLLVATAGTRAVAGSAAALTVHVTLDVAPATPWTLVLAPRGLVIDVRRHRGGAPGTLRVALADAAPTARPRDAEADTCSRAS